MCQLDLDISRDEGQAREGEKVTWGQSKKNVGIWLFVNIHSFYLMFASADISETEVKQF